MKNFISWPPIFRLLSVYLYYIQFILQGGLVKAGLDVAQIWLDGDETLVNTIDRDGNMLPINMVNGHAITHDPLVVLVRIDSLVIIIIILFVNYVNNYWYYLKSYWDGRNSSSKHNVIFWQNCFIIS